MAFQNQKKHNEFVSLKNYQVHNTLYTDVYAQLLTINGKIYLGLQRSSYFDDKNKPRLKSILLPIEAWTNFVTHAIPTLDTAIGEHHAKEPPAPETPKARKRPYSNAMLRLSFLTVQ